MTPPNQVTGPNAAGPRPFQIRTPLAARVGQFLAAFAVSRIATVMLVVATLSTCGCATHKEAAKTVLPATTPYDTNAAARAVYHRFYGDAYRIAAAGRTNISYSYQGQYVLAATEGQWQGVQAGLEVARERELQRLRRATRLPKSTPYDGEPKARAAYLRSFRDNYVSALSGRGSISCFPQTREAEAYCQGERDGERQARRDMMAVEEMCLEQFSHLTKCMARQHPQIRYESEPSLLRVLLKPFGL